MKYVHLVVRNITRNLRRTILTVLAIAVSLFLYVALINVLASMENWMDRASRGQRVAVHHKMGLTFDLPESHLGKIRGLPGVVEICPFTWYGGIFRDPKDIFSTLSVDPATFRKVWPESQAPESEWAAFARERTGCMVARTTAAKFGWRVGDEVTLRGTVRPVDLKFKIVSVLADSIDPQALFFQRAYMEEALGKPGIVSNVWVKVRRQEDVVPFIAAAEKLFENSSNEVKAETEKSFINNFLSMAGNIHYLVHGIGMIVVGVVMLVAGNSVAMSVRERTGEVAIMKALGFRPRMIVALILVEACLIGMAGGVLGCGGAYIFFSSQWVLSSVGPWGSLISASTKGFAFGLQLAILIGLGSGSVPAVIISRVQVAESLRRVV